MKHLKIKSLSVPMLLVVIGVLGVVVIGGIAVAYSGSSEVVIENVENLTINISGSDELGVFGVSGSRFERGISADSTSPVTGEVRGTTLTSTGAATLASGSVTGDWTVSGLLFGDRNSTTTDNFDFTLTGDQSRTIVFIGGVGATTTLPAVTNTGATFRISVQLAFGTNDAVVLSAEGDNINGSLFVNDAIVACSAEDKIKFIADGEAIGDFVDFLSDGTNWNIINSRGETAAKITCTDPN